MAKVLELTGMIHSKFESETAMANAMGWSKQRLGRITNGKKEPTLEDTAQIAYVLDRPFMDVANIFLRKKSPFGDAKAS